MQIKDVESLKGAADNGDPVAQNSLGYLYAKGIEGVTRDYNSAFKYFDLSSQKDNSTAKYNLGVLYWNGIGVTKSTRVAIACFKSAAEKNNDQALYTLGCIYRDNKDRVKENLTKALEYFQLSARLGNGTAQYEMGCLFRDGEYNGLKIDIDLNKSVYYFKLAAENEFPHDCAQYSLACMYRDGEGVEKNKTLATRYLTSSAELGNPTAIRMKNQPSFWSTENTPIQQPTSTQTPTNNPNTIGYGNSTF